jgi:chemotaxis protein MotB
MKDDALNELQQNLSGGKGAASGGQPPANDSEEVQTAREEIARLQAQVRAVQVPAVGGPGPGSTARLDATEQRLGVISALLDTSLGGGGESPPRREELEAQLRVASKRESVSLAALKRSADAQARLEQLVQRLESEREILYAEVDETQACVLQFEGELHDAQATHEAQALSWAAQRAELEQRANTQPHATGPPPRAPQTPLTPQQAELSMLAEEDGLYQSQIAELEAELHAAHEQLQLRAADISRLQLQLQRQAALPLPPGGERAPPRQATAVAQLQNGLDPKALQQAEAKAAAAGDENVRLREKLGRQEKLHAIAKAAALKAEAEQERGVAAAREGEQRLQAQLAGQQRHRQHLEERLEKAELAVDQTRAELAAKEAVARDLASGQDGAPAHSAAVLIALQQQADTDRQRQSEAQSAVGDELVRLQKEKITREHERQAGQELHKADIAELKHEVSQLKIKLRGATHAKSAREGELEEAVERLGRRSKLHESNKNMGVKLAEAQARAAGLQLEVDAVRLDITHKDAELDRKSSRLAQVEERLVVRPVEVDLGTTQARLRALVQENARLEGLLTAAREEFDRRIVEQGAASRAVAELMQMRDAQAGDVHVPVADWEHQQRTVDQLRERAVGLEQALAELHSKLSKAKKKALEESDLLQQRLAEMEAQHHSNLYTARQARQEAQAGSQTLAAKVQRLEEADAHHMCARRSAEALMRQLREDYESRVANATMETNEVRREACQCVSENERLHTLVDEKDRQLTVVSESVQALRSQDDATVQQQVIVLIAHLDQSHAAQCELERRLGEMQGAVQGHVVEYSAARRELQTVLGKLRETHTQLAALRKSKEGHEADLHALRLELSAAQQGESDALHEMSLQMQRGDSERTEAAGLHTQVQKQQREFFEQLHGERTQHEAAVQELKLRVLQLTHDDSKTHQHQSVFAAQLEAWTRQLRRCCMTVQAGSESGPLCDAVEAMLTSYDGAVEQQSKAQGLAERLVEELKLRCDALLDNEHVLEVQLARCRQGQLLAESRARAALRRADEAGLARKLESRSMVEVLQERIDLLVAHVRTAKETEAACVGARSVLQTERDELRKQLAKALRDVEVAGTSNGGEVHQAQAELEGRTNRLREFFESELARLASIGLDAEQVTELGQQLGAAKVLEDDFRMRVFGLEQQRDVLLTDCVVLKDVVRKLEVDLQHAVPPGGPARSDSTVAHEDIIFLKDGAAALRTELQVARQREQVLSNRVREMEAALRAAEEEVALVRHQLSATDQQNHEHLQTRQQAELKRLKDEHFDYRAEQEAELRNTQAALDEARQQMAVAAEVVPLTTEFEASVAQLRADTDSVKEENKSLVKSNTDLVAQLADARIELAAAAESPVELDRALEAQSVHEDTPRKRKGKGKPSNDPAAVLGRKLAAAQSGLAKSKAQLRVAEKLEVELRQQLAERDSRALALKAQLQEALTHNGSSVSSVSVNHGDISAVLRLELAEKQRQVHELRQSLAAAADAAAIAAAEAMAASTVAADPQGELAARAKALGESQHKVEMLEQAVEQLSAQLADAGNIPACERDSRLSRLSARRTPTRLRQSLVAKATAKTPAKGTLVVPTAPVPVAVVESSQRMVIEKLRVEMAQLRPLNAEAADLRASKQQLQQRLDELDYNLRAQSAQPPPLEHEAVRVLGENLAEIAAASTRVFELLRSIQSEHVEGAELTGSEMVLQNLEGECTFIRLACERGAAMVPADTPSEERAKQQAGVSAAEPASELLCDPVATPTRRNASAGGVGSVLPNRHHGKNRTPSRRVPATTVAMVAEQGPVAAIAEAEQTQTAAIAELEKARAIAARPVELEHKMATVQVQHAQESWLHSETKVKLDQATTKHSLVSAQHVHESRLRVELSVRLEVLNAEHMQAQKRLEVQEQALTELRQSKGLLLGRVEKLQRALAAQGEAAYNAGSDSTSRLVQAEQELAAARQQLGTAQAGRAEQQERAAALQSEVAALKQELLLSGAQIKLAEVKKDAELVEAKHHSHSRIVVKELEVHVGRDATCGEQVESLHL